MVAVPEDIADTRPVLVFTDATAGLLLRHVPPFAVEENAAEEPTQIA